MSTQWNESYVQKAMEAQGREQFSLAGERGGVQRRLPEGLTRVSEARRDARLS